ncbi:hypothetical protein GCM10010310_57560 [Streptomyces violaceolatus]|uniref:Uncharacterized protein n=1 Tax=Streptomyces violaceolatus TaxID=67378 RepID=A0ABN3T9W1_9ACTN
MPEEQRPDPYAQRRRDERDTSFLPTTGRESRRDAVSGPNHDYGAYSQLTEFGERAEELPRYPGSPDAPPSFRTQDPQYAPSSVGAVARSTPSPHETPSPIGDRRSGVLYALNALEPNPLAQPPSWSTPQTHSGGSAWGVPQNQASIAAYAGMSGSNVTRSGASRSNDAPASQGRSQDSRQTGQNRSGASYYQAATRASGRSQGPRR